MPIPSLESFEALARARRSVRHFRSDPLPEGVLERLLDCARWAPSGYNLQPVHIVVVTSEEGRRNLLRPCMDQKQVVEAPAVAIFCADLDVFEHNFEATVSGDAAAGAMTPQYEAALRKFVPLAFKRGPLGLNWFGKKFVVPLLRLFMPVPEIPAVHRRRWVYKQTALSAMNFMLAATAAGLATVPMEGFAEAPLRRVLGLPSHIVPVLVIPVGYNASAEMPKKSRLPLERMVHWERY